LYIICYSGQNVEIVKTVLFKFCVLLCNNCICHAFCLAHFVG
jgi:hypothetical protein